MIPIVATLISAYQTFTATPFGYPFRKLEKAVPDLIAGLRRGNNRKPISRNINVITAAVMGTLFGVLIPTVFAPEIVAPLHAYTQGLAIFGIFLFACTVAWATIATFKYLYGHITSQDKITNHAMLIPESKKLALAQELEVQIRYEHDRAVFGVDQLNTYAKIIQERYVKFRDLVRDFDSNDHARINAAESNIFSRPGAQVELSKAKEAMDDLRDGDWPSVHYYLQGIEEERTRAREFYQSQQQRLENTQRQLGLLTNSGTAVPFGEEGEIRDREPSKKLLKLAIKQAHPKSLRQNALTFSFWSREKTVHPEGELEAGLRGVAEAEQRIKDQIAACDRRAVNLPF